MICAVRSRATPVVTGLWLWCELPARGSLNRDIRYEHSGFPKPTSLNPTLFRGRPSSGADDR